jgi:hypothetical protein
MFRKAALLALAALIVSASIAAQDAQSGAPASEGPPGTQAEKKGDARVEGALTRLGLRYTLTSSGNFAVVYDLQNERSQTVYVMAKTDMYNGVEIREIWSNAGVFDSEPKAETLLQLMAESGKSKIGCWALEQLEDGKYLLFFSVKFPAAVGDEAYRMMLEFASAAADAREEELFGSDEN